MPSTLSPKTNYWPQSACAKAFWTQHELPAYQELLAVTVDWMDPRPGERWLDLGCGGGQLTRCLWEKSRGSLAEVVAMDCAAANEKAIRKLRDTVEPPATAEQIPFVCADFSSGLRAWPDGSFNGAVSGMAIQYAESYSEERGCWTSEAYDHLLAETYRVLRPGGRFVFSVNVPNPSWTTVGLYSVFGVLRAAKVTRHLKNALRMWRYGGWLKKEARRGRFHYLPLDQIVDKLSAVGFTDIEHRLSYARQAYLIRCHKS